MSFVLHRTSVRPDAGGNRLTRELGQLFSQMDKTADSVTPTDFVQHFRTQFPQFATRNDRGQWQQQDADECITEIFSSLTRKLRGYLHPVDCI